MTRDPQRGRIQVPRKMKKQVEKTERVRTNYLLDSSGQEREEGGDNGWDWGGGD
jgi:hypothetical protein